MPSCSRMPLRTPSAAIAYRAPNGRRRAAARDVDAVHLDVRAPVAHAAYLDTSTEGAGAQLPRVAAPAPPRSRAAAATARCRRAGNDIAPSTRPSQVTRPSRISTARARTSDSTPASASARTPGGWMPIARDRAGRDVRRSSTTASTPRRASRHARSRPTAPPPTMTTSCRGSCAGSCRGSGVGSCAGSCRGVRAPPRRAQPSGAPHTTSSRDGMPRRTRHPAGSTAASSAGRVAAPDRREAVGPDIRAPRTGCARTAACRGRTRCIRAGCARCRRAPRSRRRPRAAPSRRGVRRTGARRGGAARRWRSPRRSARRPWRGRRSRRAAGRVPARPLQERPVQRTLAVGIDRGHLEAEPVGTGPAQQRARQVGASRADVEHAAHLGGRQAGTDPAPVHGALVERPPR